MKSNSHEKTALPSCAANVTADNYRDKARAFMDMDGWHGVVIDPVNDPQQWGAWKDWFHDIKRTGSVARMRAIENEIVRFHISPTRNGERQASRTYLVPAKFPSDFCEERDWSADKWAGERFMNSWPPEKPVEMPVEHRAAVVAKATAKMSLKRNLDWRPGQ